MVILVALISDKAKMYVFEAKTFLEGAYMKRILVFGMTENPGGVESVIMNYYRNIDKSNIQFDFLCNSYEKIAYEDEILNMGGKTYHFTARSKNPLKYKIELNSFFKENAFRYDTIWVNVCSLANSDYLILAKQYGINRRIIHSHNSQNMDGKLRGLLHKHNKKRIEQIATDFWACSKEAAEWFYDISLMDKVVYIHNGIDIASMKYDEMSRNKLRKKMNLDNKYIIGNIGRLHHQKNQNFIIDIFNEYIKLNSNSHLIFVGQGSDEEKLKDKVKRLHLEDNVSFVGVQSNINEWLSMMDLFLFPSKFEGLSLSALEAEANGLPVLASDKVIPKEMRINSNFKFFDLNKSCIEWADEIDKIRNTYARKDFEEIKESFICRGYEIKNEAMKLESYFMEKENE